MFVLLVIVMTTIMLVIVMMMMMVMIMKIRKRNIWRQWGQGPVAGGRTGDGPGRPGSWPSFWPLPRPRPATSPSSGASRGRSRRRASRFEPGGPLCRPQPSPAPQVASKVGRQAEAPGGHHEPVRWLPRCGGDDVRPRAGAACRPPFSGCVALWLWGTPALCLLSGCLRARTPSGYAALISGMFQCFEAISWANSS